MTKTFGVTIENTALALSTKGVQPGAWLKNALGAAWNAIKAGVKAVAELGRKMFEGGKEIISAIARGDLGIFLDWFRNDPFGFLAGGAAVAVGGWLIGAGGAIGTAVSVGLGGIKSLWVAVGSVKFGGLALGSLLPTLGQAVVGISTTVLNTDWLQSDASILAELQGVYNSFLNVVGESTGRMLAGFIAGGGRQNPKLTINMTAAAALSIQAEQEGSDIQEELISELSNLANTFIRYARNLAAKLGLLEFRKWARQNIKTGIPWIDDRIKQWGLIEGQSFVINQKIDEKIEKITETNAPVGNFLEGFKSGLFEGLGEFILII